MPYINTITNVSITKEQEERIKTRMGEDIRLLNKTEEYLMVNMQDNNCLYFRGDTENPNAFVEVRLYGKATSQAYDQMTAAITKIIEEELHIPGNNIYVQYEEVPHWGLNGENF